MFTLLAVPGGLLGSGVTKVGTTLRRLGAVWQSRKHTQHVIRSRHQLWGAADVAERFGLWQHHRSDPKGFPQQRNRTTTPQINSRIPTIAKITMKTMPSELSPSEPSAIFKSLHSHCVYQLKITRSSL